MKLIFIDVETTGIECPETGLIQLAGIVEIDGEEKQRFDFRNRPFPEDEIAEEALAVNGITEEQLNKFAVLVHRLSVVFLLAANSVIQSNLCHASPIS